MNLCLRAALQPSNTEHVLDKTACSYLMPSSTLLVGRKKEEEIHLHMCWVISLSPTFIFKSRSSVNQSITKQIVQWSNEHFEPSLNVSLAQIRWAEITRTTDDVSKLTPWRATFALLTVVSNFCSKCSTYHICGTDWGNFSWNKIGRQPTCAKSGTIASSQWFQSKCSYLSFFRISWRLEQ